MFAMILARVVWKITEQLDYIKYELFKKEEYAKEWLLSLDDPETKMEKGQVEILVNLENKVNFM